METTLSRVPIGTTALRQMLGLPHLATVPPEALARLAPEYRSSDQTQMILSAGPVSLRLRTETMSFEARTGPQTILERQRGVMEIRALRHRSGRVIRWSVGRPMIISEAPALQACRIATVSSLARMEANE